MLRAERRRRSDLITAVALVVAVLAGAALLAVFGPAAGTTSVTATGPLPVVPPEPGSVPYTLSELWRAPSPATPAPVADGLAVVTGDADDAGGGTVVGRDLMTGAVRWTYQRDLPLCTVGVAWHQAIAVFRRGVYCSEVTALVPATGKRGPQRNSDVYPNVRLFGVGGLLGAAGDDYLEVWRRDLVRTLMYGATRTDAQPNRQPHRGCRHLSAAGTQNRLAVLERCPHESADRLTVVRPDGEQGDRPELEFSVLLPGGGTKLAAVGSDRVAVMLRDPTRLSIRDGKGLEVSSSPLDLPVADVTQPAPAGITTTAEAPRSAVWWTGSRTIGLDAGDLRQVWTVPDSLGAGTTWAGRLMIPVKNGLTVLNADTGAELHTIPVRRDGWTGPVSLSSLGPVLLEQRGPTVVALR